MKTKNKCFKDKIPAWIKFVSVIKKTQIHEIRLNSAK